MKKNILIHYGYNEYGKTSGQKTIAVQTKIMDELLDKYNLYYFTFIGKEKIKKFLNPAIEVIELEDPKSWSKYFEIIKNYQKQLNFDKIFTFAVNIPSEQLRYKNEHKLKEIYENKLLINDKFTVNFLQTYNSYRKLFLLYYLSAVENVTLYQFLYDHFEMDLTKINSNNKIYHPYVSDDRSNFEFMPFMQYALFYNQDNNYIDKEYDFIFGVGPGSLEYEKKIQMRKKIFLNILNSDFTNLNYKMFYKYEDNNNIIKKEEYDEFIKKSKFTYIMPANNLKEFSFPRFYESIAYDCIPFIDINCNWKQVFVEFPEFMKIIENNNLVIDSKDLVINLKTINYQRILSEFKNSNDYKKIKDINYYKQYISKL